MIGDRDLKPGPLVEEGLDGDAGDSAKGDLLVYAAPRSLFISQT
jgi:hypothetical protein